MKKLILVMNLMFCLSFGSPALANNIETLIKELGRKSKAKDASKALAEIGKQAVPALIQALEGKNKYQKRYAARAIREMGQTGSDAIPALEKLLKDRDTQTREYAVEALGNMLLQAEHVLPILKKATKDKNKDIAEKANRSIQKIQNSFGKLVANDDEKTTSDPNCTDFRVFGIPLNASLQQVVNALEKNEIPITDGLTTMNYREMFWSGSLIDLIYDRIWNTPSHEKEKALKLLDEKKIKSFYVKYKGKEYAAEPKSLKCLLKKRDMYPVMGDYYDIYNSQFMLLCTQLPLHMTSQGLSGMLILFASIGQSEPKSFLIGFDTSRPMGVLPNLEKKYGIPTMYYNDTIRLDDGGYFDDERYRDLLAKEIEDILRNFQHHERRPKGPLYPELSEALIVHPLPIEVYVHSYFGGVVCNYVVEWNCNDTKILLETTTTANGALVYVHWPKIRQLAGMYKKVYQASEKAAVKIVEKGRRGF
ncbi:MAG: HEAT repeat domain-containing protein [Planctomycetota bacterium]